MAAFAAVFLCVTVNASAATRLSTQEKYLTLKGKPTITWTDEKQLPADLRDFALLPDNGGSGILSSVA